MIRVSKKLNVVTGAWVERGHEMFTRIAIKCEYDLSKATPRTKKVVVTALRTGVIGSAQGMAANLFMVISDAYSLKYVCASKEGTYFVTNFNHTAFYESIIAAIALQPNMRGRDATRYVHNSLNCISTWSWRGGPDTVRAVFEQTVGVKDKEVREEAIDFFCAGGVLVNTWVDKNPR